MLSRSSSDFGRISDLITSGEPAWLVPTADPCAIGEAIAQYCNDESFHRRHGARQQVERILGVEGVMHSYQNVYGGLLICWPFSKQVTSCAE
jgi:glycosyltransferase involved in cell wall biosynthesis